MRLLFVLVALCFAATVNLAFARDEVAKGAAYTGAAAVAHVLSNGETVTYKGRAGEDLFKLYAERRAVRKELLARHGQGNLVYLEREFLDPKTGKKSYALQRLATKEQIWERVTVQQVRTPARFKVFHPITRAVRVMAPAGMLVGAGYTLKAMQEAYSEQDLEALSLSSK